jgi:hypothetical protein
MQYTKPVRDSFSDLLKRHVQRQNRIELSAEIGFAWKPVFDPLPENRPRIFLMEKP